MKIQKYLDYFHDGSLINIEHLEDEIILSIESAEMDLEDLKDDIPLSKRETIKGKLHLKNIQSISLNDQPFSGLLKISYDYGRIFDLTVEGRKVELSVSWKNSPPKSYVNDFSVIGIEADTIWWENIPDLFDPFW